MAALLRPARWSALAFFKDFNAAFADDLTKPENQEKWATKLSEYFVPESQAAQKTQIMETITQLGALPGAKVSVTDAKFEEVSVNGDVAKLKVVSGKMSMEVLGQSQEQDLADTGLAGTGGDATMHKVDGVWYLEPNN